MKIEIAEGSPVIPNESQILEIPVFPRTAISLGFTMNQLSARNLQKTSPYSFSRSLTNLDRTTCKCPYVLVCDDDPFQSFYYETLFQRSILREDLIKDKENFKFEIFSSGEELLNRYKKIKSCGCGKTVLVISDYDMGVRRLNGVETALTLRKMGFNESIILRTGEEKAYLLKIHINFAELLESKTIDSFVEKADFKKAKEVIQILLKSSKTKDFKCRTFQKLPNYIGSLVKDELVVLG